MNCLLLSCQCKLFVAVMLSVLSELFVIMLSVFVWIVCCCYVDSVSVNCLL